ncbi:MAG: hypothetical protein GY761_01555 [Hyphomicrobiales bacterium]|nr:hypothetical protein [Hyphomicrobiales bacterium]
MNTGKHQSKVIISATCFADADAAIAMATSLAQKVKGVVHGLLVEDESILRHANLPLAKAVAFQSGIPRRVTPKAMASAFRRDARMFKTILAKTANEASINWSFESKPGQLMPLLHSVSSKGDLVLLGHQRTPMTSDEIVYLNYGDSGDGSFLELANQVAREMNVPFQVISFMKSESKTSFSSGTGSASGRDNITTHHSVNQVLELLYKKSLKAAFIVVGEDNNLDIYEILEAARCPIVYLVQKQPGS